MPSTVGSTERGQVRMDDQELDDLADKILSDLRGGSVLRIQGLGDAFAFELAKFFVYSLCAAFFTTFAAAAKADAKKLGRKFEKWLAANIRARLMPDFPREASQRKGRPKRVTASEREKPGVRAQGLIEKGDVSQAKAHLRMAAQAARDSKRVTAENRSMQVEAGDAAVREALAEFELPAPVVEQIVMSVRTAATTYLQRR
jgi:hypothetical protein